MYFELIFLLIMKKNMINNINILIRLFYLDNFNIDGIE